MEKQQNIKSINITQNYKFLIILFCSMIFGLIFGSIMPKEITKNINFLGNIFINMMFCIVVPLVFASISSAFAGMKNRRTGGKILSVTLIVFIITGIIAGTIMFIILKIYPPVLEPWTNLEKGEVSEQLTMQQLITNFIVAPDFVDLLSRKSMLPLIIFSILFGFATNIIEDGEGPITKAITSLSNIMIKIVNIVTIYAPIAFFAIFANLMADYGNIVATSYARAMIVYYPLCLIYAIIAFPLFAYFGAGMLGVKTMISKILRPLIVSLGTCSSAATIPTNLEVAEESNIPKDVSDIVVPLGATMHMDGSAFACVMKIMFIFGALGTYANFSDSVPWNQMPLVVIIAVFCAVGTSGVPGGGYIGEFLVASIFFPDNIEIAFPIAVAIGNLVDPPATMINATGDYAVSFIVAKYIYGKDWLKNSRKETNY